MTVVVPLRWGSGRWWVLVAAVSSAAAGATTGVAVIDVDRLVARLFHEEGQSLVRLARLFVDDRNAAEDLVQEAFIRLARSATRIQDEQKAAAYLRSIVLNLARDHNRRGFVSLRHQLPFDDHQASVEDQIDLQDDQRRVLEQLRELAPRQRDCLVLRYFHELGIEDIASTLGLSPNSVKTHLKRGLAAMERRLGEPEPSWEAAT
jgi:RNA polymerase sigma factor (sigma-70 family)